MIERTCVILTSTFPFHGEPFIWYELEFLARTFSKVEIYSLTLGKTSRRDSAGLRRLNEFENISYAGDISTLSAKLALPPSVLVKAFFSDLPKALQSGISTLKHLYRLQLSSRIHQFLTSRYPDDGSYVFYSYWMNSGAVALAALDHAHNIRICRAHRTDLYNENVTTGFNGYQNLCIRSLDGIFCISEHGRNYLSTRSHHAGSLKVARLGVPLPSNYARANQQILPDDPIQIVTCSSIDANKRLDLLVNALSYITDVQVNWTHIGDGPEANRVKTLCKKLPNTVRVNFRGQMQNAKIHDLYRNHVFDVFVNTSLSEGIPVAAMEAMSYGIPCLATNVCGTPELIIGSGGDLFAPGIEPAVLSERLRKFVQESRSEAGERTSQARSMIQRNYHANTNFVKFAKDLWALRPRNEE